MKTKSLRIPEDMMYAVKLVEKEEKIEESTAMRKLMRIGFETYIGNLYKQGKITLREAARLLNKNQIETIDLFLDAGIKGNLDASDVLTSLERFVFKQKKHSSNP
jgi:predicted HTH domain antitoxin